MQSPAADNFVTFESFEHTKYYRHLVEKDTSKKAYERQYVRRPLAEDISELRRCAVMVSNTLRSTKHLLFYDEELLSRSKMQYM